jgi:hypothetical protein
MKYLTFPWAIWDTTRGQKLNAFIAAITVSLYAIIGTVILGLLIAPFVNTYAWLISAVLGILLIAATRKAFAANNVSKLVAVVACTVATFYILAKPLGVYIITNKTVTATLRDSEKVMFPDGTSQYRVATDIDTYKIVDTSWYLQYKSSNIHGYVKANIGKKCQISMFGTRIALLSMFPTVTKIECPK